MMEFSVAANVAQDVACTMLLEIVDDCFSVSMPHEQNTRRSWNNKSVESHAIIQCLLANAKYVMSKGILTLAYACQQDVLKDVNHVLTRNVLDVLQETMNNLFVGEYDDGSPALLDQIKLALESKIINIKLINIPVTDDPRGIDNIDSFNPKLHSPPANDFVEVYFLGYIRLKMAIYILMLNEETTNEIMKDIMDNNKEPDETEEYRNCVVPLDVLNTNKDTFRKYMKIIQANLPTVLHILLPLIVWHVTNNDHEYQKEEKITKIVKLISVTTPDNWVSGYTAKSYSQSVSAYNGSEAQFIFETARPFFIQEDIAFQDT